MKKTKLVGTWRLIAIYEDGEAYELDCEDFAETEYKEDKTYEIREFGLNNLGNCDLTGVINDEGEWKKSGEGYLIGSRYYELDFDGDQFSSVVDEDRGISEVYKRQ